MGGGCWTDEEGEVFGSFVRWKAMVGVCDDLNERGVRGSIWDVRGWGLDSLGGQALGENTRCKVE